MILEIQKGNKRALEVLHERHASKATALAAQMVKDRDVAEEVTQEAFWRVWCRAAQYRGERGSVLNWLLGIVRHLALDELARRKPLSLFEHDVEGDAQPLFALLPYDSMADHVLDRVQGQHIRAAITALPEPQREVIELSYVHGLTREQIARRPDAPLGTVHTRAALGLRKLRSLVGADAC